MATDNSSAAAAKLAREKSTLAFINMFTTFSEKDCLSLRTPSCIHHFAPQSVAIPPLSNDAFIAHLGTLRSVISSFPLKVKEVIDNPGANQVLIWCNASPVWVPEVMASSGEGDDDKEVDWAYTGEYMFLLSFEEGETGDDGEGGTLKRIERVVEFVDSYGTVRLRGLMKIAKERLEGLKEKKVGV